MSAGAKVIWREHVPAGAWARDPARGSTVSAAKEDNGWGQNGREAVVERLLVVRVIEAGRCTRNSAFLFLAQKMKRSTTCPNELPAAPGASLVTCQRWSVCVRTISWPHLLCEMGTARPILRWTAAKHGTLYEPFYHKEPGFPNSAGECSWGTPAHVSRMRSTCPHATGNRVKAGAALDERGRCPQHDALPGARIESGPSHAEKGSRDQ